MPITDERYRELVRKIIKAEKEGNYDKADALEGLLLMEAESDA